MRAVGAVAGRRAAVPAEVVQLVADVRHRRLVDDLSVGLRPGPRVDDGQEVGRVDAGAGPHRRDVEVLLGRRLLGVRRGVVRATCVVVFVILPFGRGTMSAPKDTRTAAGRRLLAGNRAVNRRRRRGTVTAGWPDGLSDPRTAGGARRGSRGAVAGRKATGTARAPARQRQPHAGDRPRSSTSSGARTCRRARRRWCRSTSRSCASRCRRRCCTRGRPATRS